MRFWQKWIGKSKYKGRWREAVHRSALTLKMLTFEATGAVVAAPTFSLPEAVGGPRNWDYRYTWIRDTSFVLYALIRLGFTEEANAFMDFILCRLKERNSDGSLQIVYTIHGGKDLGEEELTHLAGHKGSKPVRIGNGAVDHLQLVSRVLFGLPGRQSLTYLFVQGHLRRIDGCHLPGTEKPVSTEFLSAAVEVAVANPMIRNSISSQM